MSGGGASCPSLPMLPAGGTISLKHVRLWTLLALLASCLVPAHGQERGSASLAGRTISRVDFDPAEQPLPREELDRLLPFHAGDPLRMAGVREAIQNLYATGRYADISVDAEPTASGVELRFVTQDNYFISRVNVAGDNEPPNRNQLVSASKLELGRQFHADEIEQSVDSILERLRANGLYQAGVQHRVDLNPATEEASVYFDIHAGDRAHFAGVNLSGQFTQSREELIETTDWKRGLGPIPLPGWREITENRLQTGLEKLRRELQKDDRLQATVRLDRREYDPVRNRVTPYLIINQGPVIEVRVTGADIGESDLRELLPIYQERSVDRGLLIEGNGNLVRYFQSQGYFDAQVSYNQTQGDQGQTVIEYKVDRGVKHKLESIEITGNRFFDIGTLRERMLIQPATFLRYRSGRYSPQLLEQDVAAIRDLYRTNGFREVQVDTQVDDLPGAQHTSLSLHIAITEGPQWFVNQLTIDGIPQADSDYLMSTLRSTAGQPYSETNVAADRDTILTYYYNGGYTNADFEWTTEPGPQDNVVNLHYTVTPGEVQYVRGVLVRGLETTNPQIVAERIELAPGDAISQSRIAASQQRLYDLGIFSKVETAIQNPDGREESKYVLFHADEARKYSFNFAVGAEFGRISQNVISFNAPAGATGFAPRLTLGISRINLLGLGHTVSLQTLTSTLQRRALLNYLAPQFKGNENLSLSFTALFNDARNTNTFAAHQLEGTVQLADKLTRANNLQFRYSFRRVTVSSLKISPNLIPLLSRPVRVGLIGATFFQDRRDDPVNSHRGIYNTVDLGYASAKFGSSTTFTRLLLRNSTYYPIGKDIVIARSIQFGYIQRFGGLAEIPLAERFFGGGASNHRGFPANQAGPRDLDTGFPLGGNALLFHSTELRFPLIGDNIGGVLFHDMGNIFADVRDINFRVKQRSRQDFNYMVHAVGFGIRYSTPLGPVRLDLAYAPNSPQFNGFKGTLTDLLACGDTCPSVPQRISRFQFHFSLGQTF